MPSQKLSIHFHSIHSYELERDAQLTGREVEAIMKNILKEHVDKVGRSVQRGHGQVGNGQCEEEVIRNGPHSPMSCKESKIC